MRHALRCAWVVATIASVQTATAQSVATADSLLRRGSLERAESLYYAAAKARPHDPTARWGLGRYLAGRGATKVGVTLMEEAMRFGGDSTRVGSDLEPLYLALWDYKAMLNLRAAVVAGAERERARWLESHPTRLVAPDSVVTVLYNADADSGYLGRIPIRINGRTVEAVIGVTSGLVLSDSTATAVRARRFAGAPAAGTGSIAAVDSLGIGRLAFMNLPARVASIRAPAIIGLDVLGKLAPTFDPKASRMTLRVNGSVPGGGLGDRFPTWSTTNDVQLLQAGGWISVVRPPVSELLGERLWTLDAKRGHLIFGR